MNEGSGLRRRVVPFGIAIAVIAPTQLSGFDQSQAALAAITGILVISVVLLSGFVGQISFCQFSFAAIGAFTTGVLVDGQGWSFWIALPIGVIAAAAVGVLVGIPALRLSGLLLAVLTVAVALFFDRFVLLTDTWPAFSGGSTQWHPHKPSILGFQLTGEYGFYLFTFAAFLIVVLLVWNLRTGKAGRVLRAVRDSELAAGTMGINVTAWKLAAFGLSAGIAGLAGCLLAVGNESVSAGSYDFLHSVQLIAIATVWGVGSLSAAALGGAFFVYGPELLAKTPLSASWFSLILGVVLVAQLVYSPEGIIPRSDGGGRVMALLEIEHVSKHFGGVQALEDVSFEVREGEILGLIGPNGAGKTTMFNIVSGVFDADSGQVRYQGHDIRGVRPHRRARLGIARTFQNLQLFRRMTVLENLMVPADAFARRGLLADALRLPVAAFEERRAEERARSLLHFLGIEHCAGAFAGDLSVGLQRRVELGRALCLRPTLLLLDEPAAGLDARETADLAATLIRVRERFGLTVLLVDHDMALVMRACDHIYVLDFGRLIADDAPEQIRQNPTVIRAYLGEAA